MMSAHIRGKTSNSMGSRPIVRMASTSSLTFMVPIWAVNALPERPASMIAVSSTPISRNTPDATILTVNISTPNRANCSAP